MAERNTVTEANSPDNAPPQPLLDDEQLDRLDDFLDSEQVGEDALDLISAHGFLVALAVAPSEQPTEQWLEELFQGEPNYHDAAERERLDPVAGESEPRRDVAESVGIGFQLAQQRALGGDLQRPRRDLPFAQYQLLHHLRRPGAGRRLRLRAAAGNDALRKVAAALLRRG